MKKLDGTSRKIGPFTATIEVEGIGFGRKVRIAVDGPVSFYMFSVRAYLFQEKEQHCYKLEATYNSDAAVTVLDALTEQQLVECARWQLWDDLDRTIGGREHLERELAEAQAEERRELMQATLLTATGVL